MVRYQIIYWRDVPTQVRVKAGRKRASSMLPQRFQQTMYRAAYRAKAISGDAYSESFRQSEWQTISTELAKSTTLDAIVQSIVHTIDVDYSDEQLNGLALNKGRNVEKR